MINVLVVDDSLYMRRIISAVLSEDKEISVAGTASNGQEAFEKTQELKPSVVIMDLQMPKMNGLQALQKIFAECDQPPQIIIFSAYAKHDTDLAFSCLEAGAFSCISKPKGSLSTTLGQTKEELINQIKTAAISPHKKPRISGARKKKMPLVSKQKDVVPIVIIGASTGGPPVLTEIIQSLPTDFHAQCILVQHMPALFTKAMAKRLDSMTDLKVKEAEDGEALSVGTVHVAPGDFHTRIVRGATGKPQVKLTHEAPRHNLRPAIDITMESAAAEFGPLVTGVICTGMGHDGTDGMKAVKAHGGKTLVQDPSSCVVDSMPESVIEAGVVDEIYKPEKIASAIVHIAS